MIAMIARVSLEAHATDCVPTTQPPQELALEGATAVAVRGVVGAVTIGPASGDVMRVEAESCGAEVRLRRVDGVPTLQSRGRGALVVRVSVPAGVRAVSLLEVTGAVDVHDVPARIAVITSAGPVTATDVAGLRVAWHRGDVRAVRVGTDPVVDHLDGELTVDAGLAGGGLQAR